MTAAGRLLTVLGQRRWTVAVAESLTGGMVAASLTDVPGASESFRGGIVAYATGSKSAVLGVPADLLSAHGPVAPEMAAAMALAARVRFAADVGLATTGAAGPEPQGDAPVGLAYVAVAPPGGDPVVRGLQLAGDRAAIRRACVVEVLGLALEVLEVRE